MSIFTLLGKLHKWFSPSDRSNDIEVKLSLVRLKSGITYSLLGGLDITQALMIIYYKPLKVVTIELSSGPVYVDWDDIEHTETFEDSRDLDKLIAEKVFNWTDIKPTKATERRPPVTKDAELTGKDPNSNRSYRHYLLHYSTNPVHSAEVLGFCKQSWSVRFEKPKYSNLWVCILTKEGSPTIHVEDELGPRAICIAALRSVGVDYKG